MAHAALKWIHGILPLASNPLDAGLCKNFVEAEKRSRLEPVKKKEPVSFEWIRSIINEYAHDTTTIKDLRFPAMCVLCFVGIFRSNELLNIQLCNMTVFSDNITIRLPESKTDVYREGQDVSIQKSGNFTCPYWLLLR